MSNLREIFCLVLVFLISLSIQETLVEGNDFTHTKFDQGKDPTLSVRPSVRRRCTGKYIFSQEL